MRTIVIGDIHGCNDALNALLEKVQPAEEDMLVLLGDLFDRGPDSWEVFRTVQDLAQRRGERFALLRGNHEDYLLRDRMTFSERLMWDRVGRGATVKSFKRHRARMEDAAPWLREHCLSWWAGERFRCVHAGLRAEDPEENDSETLFHDHDVVQRNRYAGPLTVVGHIALGIPMWFSGDGGQGTMLTPGEWLPLPDRGFLCIDTGCGKGGWLTVMIAEGDRYRLEAVPENG